MTAAPKATTARTKNQLIGFSSWFSTAGVSVLVDDGVRDWVTIGEGLGVGVGSGVFVGGRGASFSWKKVKICELWWKLWSAR